jgi:hypothetical protein
MLAQRTWPAGSARSPFMNERRTDLVLAAAIFAGGAAYFASFAPWQRPLLLDAATWDYMAVEVSRGLVPYRDVFLHKTPGSALIGATGAAAGRALGFEPVLAAHALFLLFGALAPVLLFALCRSGGMARGAATAAAIALLAYDEWTIAALEGCRPKVPTTLLGLAAMLAAERGRGTAASIFAGASVLCWQPGVAFLLGAWAALIARWPAFRSLSRLALLALASLVPTALLLGWLHANGALGDFYEQAVLFNLHYIEDKARPPTGTLRALARSFGDWNDVELLLAPAALAGLWSVRREAAGWLAGTGIPRSVLVSGAIYGAMTFVSYQSWPDAILLGPLVATLLGAGLFHLFRSRLSARTAAALAALVLLLAAIPDSRPKFQPPIDFATQRERFRALAGGSVAGGQARGGEHGPRIVGVSVPEFFLHTGRRNGWKWPYLWFGVDDFAAREHQNGFEGILADLDADPPALMLVARLWAGPQRARFEQWASERYDVRSLRIFPHTRRSLKVYRLRGAAARGQ